MSAYQIDIQTTSGSHNPDEPEPRGMGVGMACSTVWCRVQKGDLDTGWHQCKGVVSMHKARAYFRFAEAYTDDVDGMMAVAFEIVTGAPRPL